MCGWFSRGRGGPEARDVWRVAWDVWACGVGSGHGHVDDTVDDTVPRGW